MTVSLDVRDRTIGALVGLAIGDALGAPVENLSRETIAHEHPDGFANYVNRAESGLRPGQGTDDTEMAFLVVESLIEKRHLDMPDIARRLIDWGRDNPALGPSTGAAIAALARGVHWQESGQAQTASSGCLPRCAPVALFSDIDHVVDDSLACCRPTHQHPLAIAATVTQNLLLVELLQGGSWPDAYALLDNASSQHEHYLKQILTASQDGPAPEGAVAVLVEAMQCMNTATNAAEAIVASIVMGGDTDTRAAVAGALAGATWGFAELPQAWINGCEAAEEAKRLAAGLLEIKVREDI